MTARKPQYAEILIAMGCCKAVAVTSVTELLTTDHCDAVEDAILSLSARQGGARLRMVLEELYGLNGEPKTQVVLSSLLQPPVSKSFVGSLRKRALEHLGGMPVLQPVALHLVQNGIISPRLQQTATLASPAQIAAIEQAKLPKDWRLIPLRGLPQLKTRIISALYSDRVVTLGDLYDMSAHDLHVTPQLGPAAAQDIATLFEKIGLR